MLELASGVELCEVCGVRTHAIATRALQRKLGRCVDRSEKGCWAASFDSSKLSFLPEAVITPLEEAEVGVVLELANKHGVPVTVRGRGTTLMGSAVPLHGGWVIDMLHLKSIRIDAEAG
ncbi:MAG: FAD-binding protein, partial [Cephaloticoccus sp.]|nr:FAD-binding protein [Cephaloticoccus sp.]